MSTKYRFVLTLGILFFFISARPTFAQATKPTLSPAEEYVLKQVAAGDTADLEQQFKKSEADRVIRASFLERLVMNQNSEFKINKMGIQIVGARIPGSLNLANTEVSYYLYLAKCHFDEVDFFQTVFKKGLTVDGSTFAGKVDFSYATVMEGLSANNASFLNGQELANFDTIKVGGHVFFDNATFAGPVTFVYAVISGSFEIKNAKFLNADQEVSFNTMRIDSGFFSEGAVFEGPVNSINLRISDNFEGRKTTFKKLADFQMMSLGHNLFLSGATFVGPARFKSATVGGNVELNETQFQNDEPPQFQDMKAGAILVNKTRFSHPPNLTNLTYQNIYPTSGLLDLVRNSGSDYSAYTELEKCLQRNGYASDADEVFMEMKRYERRRGLTRFDSLKSYLSEALQGFGRRPQRVVYWDLGIVLIGALFFRRRKMALKSEAKNQTEPQAETKKDLPPYNSFLFSLTLFAPTIDSQYTNNWEPADAHKRTRRYMRVHKFLGYLLVPLTFAIWTGVFK
jgi:hypothetical protein